jgi:hypothetical protein
LPKCSGSSRDERPLSALAAKGTELLSEEARPGRVFVSVCAAGFLAALALRLALLFAFPGNSDSESYRIVADIAARGGDIYSETRRYNYSPAWGQILRGLDRVRAGSKLDLTRAVGLALTAADLATAALIYLLASERFGPRRSALVALLFFANPVSILISSFHGQFDNISILLLLAAILVSRRGGSRSPLTIGWLSLSLCLKHVTWFHPLLFAWRGRRRFSLAVGTLPYAAFLISFLPYGFSWGGISNNVFRYRSLRADYGLSRLLVPFPGMPLWVLTAVLILAMLAAIAWLAPVEISRASLLLFLVQLIFLPGFGRQYCVWPVALGALFPSVGYFLYTLVSAGFLVGAMSREGTTAHWLPGSSGPWWAAIAWLLWEARALSRQRTLVAGACQ